MKIIALAGSPRKNGNSDTLLNESIKALEAKNSVVEKFYLDDLEVKPCIACDSCKNHPENKCIHDDDMQLLGQKLAQADLWLIATPIYWWGPTAQLKLVIDRWYSLYREYNLAGKKAAIIITMGDTEYQTAIPTILMFEMAFSYLKMDSNQPLVVTAHDKNDVANDKVLLEKAYNYGVEISKLVN
jgi:multimeric flavodoxin WrbA